MAFDDCLNVTRELERTYRVIAQSESSESDPFEDQPTTCLQPSEIHKLLNELCSLVCAAKLNKDFVFFYERRLDRRLLKGNFCHGQTSSQMQGHFISLSLEKDILTRLAKFGATHWNTAFVKLQDVEASQSLHKRCAACYSTSLTIHQMDISSTSACQSSEDVGHILIDE